MLASVQTSQASLDAQLQGICNASADETVFRAGHSQAKIQYSCRAVPVTAFALCQCLQEHSETTSVLVIAGMTSTSSMGVIASKNCLMYLTCNTSATCLRILVSSLKRRLMLHAGQQLETPMKTGALPPLADDCMASPSAFFVLKCLHHHKHCSHVFCESAE